MFSNGARITIRGLYDWDNGIFDSMQLPDGPDRQLCIDTILNTCDAFRLIYPDWDAMQRLIGVWSASNGYTIKTLWETTQFEYNPIHNYDRTEEWTDTKGTTLTQHGSSTLTPGSTQETTLSRNTYETNTMTATDKSFTENGGADSSESDGTQKWSGSDTRKGRLSGNIGVMSTQDMIKQQRDVAEFNFYTEFAKLFKNEFCVMVY